jgi:DNA-binding XRE family transcriptional regulator
LNTVSHYAIPGSEDAMAKTGTAKSNVQFIHTPGGGDLAVLPRNEYDRLVALATEAQEDAAASRIVRNSTRALKEGREVVLPKAVADRLANGENAVRVIREWRDMIQGELAVAAGISQNYLSGIETGRRKGPAELQKKFARALGVPIDLLIE